VVESFSGPCLTKYGGAGLWRRFLAKLHLPQLLAEVRCPWPGRRFQAVDYLMALLAGLLLGLQRQSEVADLGEDPGACLALGLAKMPSQSSLSRFLAACPATLAVRLLALNRELLGRLRHNYRSATIDLDGQVVSTRGNPQGATFGFNRKRRGAKSYFMMMGVLAEARDILDAWLYPGHRATVSARAATQAYRRARRALGPAVKRLRLRADAAFYSDRFLSTLEHDQVTYFVAVPMYQPLQAQVPGLIYCQLDRRWALAQFRYQGRRLVVLRELLDPTNPDPQKTLFTCDSYAYQMIVTNADWKLEDVWHFYNQRCRIENIIKESQYDFGSNHVLSAAYGGNATWLALSVLAYNLSNWFREKILNQRAHRKMATWLRRHLIEIPGRLVYSGRRHLLRLWREHPSRSLYEKALRTLEAWAL
jgi:hypothetical protein